MPAVSPTKYLVMAGWDDTPHMDEKTKRELLEATPVHLRMARSKGIPIPGSGLIFPIDESTITVASGTSAAAGKTCDEPQFAVRHELGQPLA